MHDPMNFAETFFKVTGFLALGGWLLLLLSMFARKARPTIWPITQFVLPAILCLGYLLMVWQGRDALDLPDSFTKHWGVQTLYQNDYALTASWLHFLALDLFAGTWMARDGTERGMPLPLILICLPLTFLFGPAGLLVYIVLRFAVRPRATPDAG